MTNTIGQIATCHNVTVTCHNYNVTYHNYNVTCHESNVTVTFSLVLILVLAVLRGHVNTVRVLPAILLPPDTEIVLQVLKVD